ncbi:hypothetical protein JHK87_050408 [Glycine soja]|nr:hypothetical protein JHK87_050408 [Glycine soja]
MNTLESSLKSFNDFVLFNMNILMQQRFLSFIQPPLPPPTTTPAPATTANLVPEPPPTPQNSPPPIPQPLSAKDDSFLFFRARENEAKINLQNYKVTFSKNVDHTLKNAIIKELVVTEGCLDLRAYSASPRVGEIHQFCRVVLIIVLQHVFILAELATTAYGHASVEYLEETQPQGLGQ